MFFDSDGRRHPIFLIGGGEMGARIRDHDWASTPLGAPEGWPQSLRSALSICLNSSFPTAIYWGRELRLLYNDAWAPIPAERHPWALGRPGREVWSDIWPVVGPQFAAVMDSGESVSLYDQLLPMVRDGRPRETYWNYSFTPIRGEDGSVTGVFNQGNETTASVLARREAEAEVARLGPLFAQAPGAIAILRGPRHVFELVNPAYEALVGRTDLIGRPVAEAMPEVVEQGFGDLLDGVLAGGEPCDGRAAPIRLRRAGETVTLHVDFVYQPLFDPDGRPSGVFAQITDVTETSRAVAAMRESEEFSRSVLQASGDCVVVLDADGAVSFVNENGLALLERDGLESLLGAPWVDLWPADGRAAAGRALSEARAGGVGRFASAAASARGAERHWEVVVTAARGADGAPSRFVAIQRDVSERQRGEEARGLLLQELDHRVKNLFAIAAAMVSITSRSSATVAEMRDALRGRLDALAAAHALVRPAIAGSASAASGADLAALVAQVVRPHLPAGAEAADAAKIDGPEFALGATAATSFALILHELATNAVKYGAFSHPDGRLSITWRREDDRLVLDWDERTPSGGGGAPAAQGFGSRLAHSSATGSLGGGISYEWRPIGPRIRIEASLERLSL